MCVLGGGGRFQTSRTCRHGRGERKEIIFLGITKCHLGEFQKLFKKYFFTPFLYGLAPLDVPLFSPLKSVAGVVQGC